MILMGEDTLLAMVLLPDPVFVSGSAFPDLRDPEDLSLCSAFAPRERGALALVFGMGKPGYRGDSPFTGLNRDS
jgi:hypothetical protein